MNRWSRVISAIAPQATNSSPVSKATGPLAGLWQLMAGNAVSKVTGLLREVLFAAWFGTSGVAAAYRIAQAAFYQPVQGLTGDTMGGGVLPLYQKIRREDEQAARVFAAVVFSHAVLVGLAVGTPLYLWASEIVSYMASTAPGSVHELATALLRLMAWGVPLYILGNSVGYIEAAHGSFGTISSRPTLLNVGLIAGAGLAVGFHDPHWLGYLTVLFQALFCAWTILGFYRLRLRLPDWDHVRRHIGWTTLAFWRNTLPLLVMPIAAQTGLVIERIVASRLGTAVIPALDYARFISETALNVTAVPLSIITLANHGGRWGERAQVNFQKIVSSLLVMSFPLAAFIAADATDVVKIVYARGAFNAESVAITAATLTGFGLGFWSTVTGYFLIKSMNAQLMNAESAIIITVAFASNALFDVLAWQHFGPITLGLGSSLNGLILVAICFSRLRLWRQNIVLVATLLITYTGLVFIAWTTPRSSLPFLNLSILGAVSTIAWIATYMLSPTVRAAASPLVRRALGILKIFRDGARRK